MAINLFKIKSFRGGISDWEDSGIDGAFKFASNLDIRKNVDSISCGYALADDLATGTLDGLILFIVNSTDGNSYHFTDTGKIYKRTSAGVYSLVYTDAGGAIKGACEWGQNNGKSYIFWATNTALHSKEIPGLANWTDVDATIGTTTYPKVITAATWHTMKPINGNMYFCNSGTLGMVGYDTSYTSTALTLTPGNLARCLMEYKSYAYIGCFKSDAALNAELFVWDAISSLNWNVKDTIPSNTINCLLNSEFPMMQIGTSGQLMFSDISKNIQPITAFPSGGQVYPDAVESEDGVAYFGVYGNGTGKSGVYTYGRKKSNADSVLNLEHQLDCAEIGSIRRVGSDLLISYETAAGTGWGVKKVSTNRANGIYQSLDLLFPSSIKETTLTTIRVITAPLPSGTSIECLRKMDKNGSYVACNLEGGSTAFNTVGGQEAIFLVGDKGKIAEFELLLNSSGTSTPEVYIAEVYFE